MYTLKVLCVLMLAATTACTLVARSADFVRAEIDRETAPATDNRAALVADNTAFAFDLYHQLAQSRQDNFILSPYSISLAFAMLYAGANGETAAQIAETMHYTLPGEQLHEAFNALDLGLHSPDQSESQPTSNPPIIVPADNLTLTVANALWGQVGFPVEPAYLNILGQHYGAGLGAVDFAGDPESARQTTNQWIEAQTNGRVTDMVAPNTISAQTRLLLTNAVYFKGEWTYPFIEQETHNGTFYLADGASVSASMMVKDRGDIACVRGDNYYAIEMTYGSSESAAMLILLPDAGEFQNFERTLNAQLLENALAGLQETNLLDFTMPRFRFSSAIDLREALSALGMTAPFTDEADFTNMTTSGQVFVDTAVHSATIAVDEQGTEATGVTKVVLLISGNRSFCGPQLAADRPFIFIIYDRETSAVLFLGRVMNPAEA